MNLFADMRALVVASVEALAGEGKLPAGLDTAGISVEPPRDRAHGDMATNAAMVLAKPAGMAPKAIAEALAERLALDPRITAADVAGPGFLNLRLADGLWQGVVRAALTEGADFGRSTLGQGLKVNVEFVSANPTGPMHVGHVRGAVVGDALARLLAFSGWQGYLPAPLCGGTLLGVLAWDADGANRLATCVLRAAWASTRLVVAIAAFWILWRWRMHPALVIVAGGIVAALVELAAELM